MWGIIKACLLGAFIGCSFFQPLKVNATSIAPTVIDLAVTQGMEVVTQITIINDSEDTKNYTLSMIGVDVGTSPDNMTFFELDEDTASWFDLSQSNLQLAGNEELEIELMITPSLVAPSQVVTIGVQILENVEASSGVGVSSGFISLVFITVGSDLEENFELIGFSFSPKIAASLPIEFNATIQNRGQRVVQPEGLLEIDNIFGKTVKRIEINPNFNRVTQDQIRTFNMTWGEGERNQNFFKGLKQEIETFHFGVYRTSVEFRPWINGETISAKKTLIIIPWRTVSVALLLIFSGITLIKWQRAAKA
ncbi:MAG: hypothetical protein ABH846_04115 [Patescibacteria group bacterium]